MEKLLINVYMPANEMTFDVFVPQDEPVGELIKLICNGMKLLQSDGRSVEGIGIMVHDDTQRVLAPDKTLADYCVRNGAMLILL